MAATRALIKLLRAAKQTHSASAKRRYSVGINSHPNPAPFGLLLDIDGVVCRGKVVLPGAVDAFQHITDANSRFLVPTVFVTNAGNCLRITKAEQLSQRLGINISADQVVLSHSPLKQFSQLHDKHILAVGQGPLLDIARNCGFSRVTTLDHLRSLFPHLDCTDFRRRVKAPYAGVSPFAPIEAIVLFGEPLNWESALQFILDVLITDGTPDDADETRGRVPYPHLPVLACNTDLLWMAETTPLPRLGHGTFLLCLETLYRKLTGQRLHYTALMGKPAEVTYQHAAYAVYKLSQQMGMPPPPTLYAIGDNPESDILGANLFDRMLQQTLQQRLVSDVQEMKEMSAPNSKTIMRSSDKTSVVTTTTNHTTVSPPLIMQDALMHGGIYGVRKCYSMLVETGVYSANCKMNSTVCGIAEQTSMARFAELRQPDFYERDIWSAVQTACSIEGWSPPHRAVSKSPA